MKNPTARSRYIVQRINGFILIVDTGANHGFMSVTNDMENVLHDISVELNLNLENTKIIYRDSENIWDGIVCKQHGTSDAPSYTVEFIYLGTHDKIKAMELFNLKTLQMN